MNFEDYIDEYKVKSFVKFRYAPISPLEFSFDECTPIGEGYFSKVYKVRLENRNWIIKEGTYKLKARIYKNIYIPLPRTLVGMVLSKFGVEILPTHKNALKQFQEYAEIENFFGFFGNKSKNQFENRIYNKQAKLRYKIKNELQNRIGFGGYLESILNNETLYQQAIALTSDRELMSYNFIAKESLILAEATKANWSIRKFFLNKLDTYYIIQDFVKGASIGAISDIDISGNDLLRKRFCLFIILCFAMIYYHNKIIDIRPENGLIANDWLRSTGNILIDLESSSLKLIDTRFLRKNEGNIIEKGIFIANMARKSFQSNLVRFLGK